MSQKDSRRRRALLLKVSEDLVIESITKVAKESLVLSKLFNGCQYEILISSGHERHEGEGEASWILVGHHQLIQFRAQPPQPSASLPPPTAGIFTVSVEGGKE